MTTLWLDLESYSECDLIKHGTHRYAEHPSTEIMIAQWALDDAEPTVLDMSSGINNIALPDELVDAFDDPGVDIVAHNSVFDRTILRHCWGIDVPIERWRDTMVKAYACGLPGALGKVGEALELDADQQKDKRGRELIQLFCKPRPKNHTLRRATRETHPNEWAEFLEYSRQDIIAMREIDHRLPQWNYRPGHKEMRLWHLDQRINDRGFQVDTQLAEAAIAAVKCEQERIKGEVQDATDGLVSGPSKRDELLAFILMEYGVDLPDMRADTLRRRLEDPELPDGVKLLISLRLEATKTSTAKYTTLLRAVSADGRLRNTLQFGGAQRTMRWAGRMFQPQNMPRPDMPADAITEGIEALLGGYCDVLYTDVMRVTSNAVRGCIVAAPGKKLCIADLANIEGRGLVYLSGERWKLKAFEAFDEGTGFDMYVMAYARAFGLDPAKVTKDQRQIGKVMELGLGYEGGVAAFLTFAAVYNMDLQKLADAVWAAMRGTQALEDALGMWKWATKKHRTLGLPMEVYVACEILKRAWRDAHPATTALWASAGEAVRSAIGHPGQAYPIGQHLLARKDGAWLRVRLPSGRYLCYLQPRVDEGGQISYMGVNQYTRQWCRIKTYGGKLIENCLAGDTEVLTTEGWIQLRSVSTEKVWDGVEWVQHGGLSYGGKRTTISAFGVRMTADHFVLTTKGWRRASSCEGLDRADCRLPDGNALRGERREKVDMGSALYVRQDRHATGVRAFEAEEKGDSSVLRVHARSHYQQQEHDARHVEASGFRRVAEHDRSLSLTVASRLGQLRRAGYQGVRALVEGLCSILGRHGPDLPAGAHAGAAQQRQGLFQGQLRLGDAQSASEQHQKVSPRLHTRRATDGDASCGGVRGQVHDVALPAGPRVAYPPSAEPVFDLVNCGPRQRFTVRGLDGVPFIVHNCTQAFARDVMAENMPRVEDSGYPIVLTVHDELLTEVPDTPDFTHEALAGMMTTVPTWAPGIPLAAAGFETYRYRKD